VRELKTNPFSGEAKGKEKIKKEKGRKNRKPSALCLLIAEPN